MNYTQSKTLNVINTLTGKKMTFTSQIEFAKAVGVNRASITKWVKKASGSTNGKKYLLRKVWGLADDLSEEILKHRKYLLNKPNYSLCMGCDMIINILEVEVCPICKTRR